MGVTRACMQVLSESWEAEPGVSLRQPPRALTASALSRAEQRTFWLRRARPPPFSRPCHGSLLVFPEINGRSILGRQ